MATGDYDEAIKRFTIIDTFEEKAILYVSLGCVDPNVFDDIPDRWQFIFEHNYKKQSKNRNSLQTRVTSALANVSSFTYCRLLYRTHCQSYRTGYPRIAYI